jgi:[histone H3]-lysine36 N-dimethyltransferase SETMAR
VIDVVVTMMWTGRQRAFVVEAFIKSNGSLIATRRAFRTHFALGRHDPVPHHKTILLWVENFRASGSALKNKPPGRPRNVRIPTNVDLVKQAIQQSPQRSARKHAVALGISDRSVRRILHLDLKFHPYKMMIVQELSEKDWETRKRCSEVLLKSVPADAFLLTSDEAHFHLSGYVNKQNFRYWADQNPCQLHERPLHSQRVTVWCAVAYSGVYGPYFFEEEGQTATVTSARYVNMLQNFLGPTIAELGRTDIWYQQDGATAHTSKRSMEVLREMFPQRLISMRGDVCWPARSPDLAPCDFFLWGYLKAEVYKHRPKSLDELKAAIRQEIEAIPAEMTFRAMKSFRQRLHQCIASDGRHLSDIVFKTT